MGDSRMDKMEDCIHVRRSITDGRDDDGDDEYVSTSALSEMEGEQLLGFLNGRFSPHDTEKRQRST
jgi:hypothetical protein